MLETVESVAQGEGEHSDQAAAARARQLLSTPPGDTDRAPGDLLTSSEQVGHHQAQHWL